MEARSDVSDPSECVQPFPPRAYDRFPQSVHDLDTSRQISSQILYDLLIFSGWDPDYLHDLQQHKFSVLDLFCAAPAQPLTTAGEELLDDLDHDLSVDDLVIDHYICEVCNLSTWCPPYYYAMKNMVDGIVAGRGMRGVALL